MPLCVLWNGFRKLTNPDQSIQATRLERERTVESKGDVLQNSCLEIDIHFPAFH